MVLIHLLQLRHLLREIDLLRNAVYPIFHID